MTNVGINNANSVNSVILANNNRILWIVSRWIMIPINSAMSQTPLKFPSVSLNAWIVIECSRFVSRAKEYNWLIPGTWNRSTWLSNVMFKLGKIILLMYKNKLKDILAHASMPRSLNMFPQGHILEGDVWFNIIWCFGKKSDTCDLHIGQENGQFNVESCFWHSKQVLIWTTS